MHRELNAAEALDLLDLREKIRDAESDLRERVRALRRAGVTCQEIGAVLSVSRDTISRWDTGRSEVAARRGRRLCASV